MTNIELLRGATVGHSWTAEERKAVMELIAEVGRLSKAWKFMQKEKARANEEARVWFERLKTAEAEGARLKKSIAEDYWPIPKECD